jgi:hypothetical protein
MPTTAVTFASGLSRPANARPFVRVGAPIGMVAGEMSPAVRKIARDYAGAGGKVFIDSGAYNAFTKGGVVDFDKVIAVYHDVADGCAQPENIFVVMPDRIGDQMGTLELLQDHADEIRKLWDRGMTILIPFQDGELKNAELYGWTDDAIGGLLDACVPAFAFKQRAWTTEGIAAFCEATEVPYLHLLGGGPSKVRVVQPHCPKTIIGGDANRACAWVGRKDKVGKTVAAFEESMTAVGRAFGMDEKAARKWGRRTIKDRALEVAAATDAGDPELAAIFFEVGVQSQEV